MFIPTVASGEAPYYEAKGDGSSVAKRGPKSNRLGVENGKRNISPSSLFFIHSFFHPLQPPTPPKPLSPPITSPPLAGAIPAARSENEPRGKIR